MGKGTMTRFDYADILVEALHRVRQGVQGSLEEIIEQIKGELQQEDVRNFKVPYTTLIENTLSLPIHLRRIYFHLLENADATSSEITMGCKIESTEAEKGLRQLLETGFIQSKVNLGINELTYSVPRFKKIGKRKQAWRAFLFGPTIPLIFHYNLLCDSSRLEGFKVAIDRMVEEGDVVVDLGTGTGVLALLAARKASKVYAVEIDPFIIETARNIVSRYPGGEKIEFIEADAKTLNLGEKVDVVICEMLDTALIAEDQVPVMNHAVAEILKPGGKVIPLRATTTIELVNSDYNFCDYEFNVPYHEEYGARPVQAVLSDCTALHSIRFDEINPTRVDKEITFELIKDGLANGFRLKTFTYLDEQTALNSSIWFNPPLVFPLGNGSEAQKGGKLSLSIYYEMGAGPGYVSYSLT